MTENHPIHPDCSSCTQRCDRRTRDRHDFQADADYAGTHELELAELLSGNPGFTARKTRRREYPDIEVIDTRTGKAVCYVEVKALRRAFMSVERLLPAAGLTPPETVELNTSDLLRYVRIHHRTGKKVFVLWRISERACLTPEGGYRCFFGDVEDLILIHARTMADRTYRRRTGSGDIVNGEHKGVVVNFHYSIRELTEARPENRLREILEAAGLWTPEISLPERKIV